MAVIKSFCFYFSCRLGSLIVGVLNLVQILFWIGICSYNLIHIDAFKQNINELLMDEEKDYSDVSDILISMKTNSEKYLNWSLTFFVFFALACLLMMYGVYKFYILFVLPFVLIDFVYITSLLIVYVMSLLILKKNDHGLGPLILYSILGEFIFLYKYYTWFCVVSFCQIVYELKKQMTNLVLVR